MYVTETLPNETNINSQKMKTWDIRTRAWINNEVNIQYNNH